MKIRELFALMNHPMTSNPPDPSTLAFPAVAEYLKDWLVGIYNNGNIDMHDLETGFTTINTMSKNMAVTLYTLLRGDL